jgi:formylglycine-generating enzyme required for sulfatase activity
MRKLLVLISIACFTLILAPAHAAKIIKAAKPVKERLVLMPMLVGAQERSLQGAMETALIEGLEQKYEVYSGDRVRQKVKEIFSRESKVSKKECDETRCMEDIAIAFQAELIAVANVTKQDGGYFLALSIQNIADQKAVYSKSLPCKGCDAFEVVEKLKELSGASTAVAAAVVEPEPDPIAIINKTDPESSLWNEVQKGNSVDDYNAYLTQYPRGKYVALAKSRSKKLQDQEAAESRKQKAEAAAEAAQQDQNAWESANNNASEDGYTDYLNNYPRGQFASLANARIAKLKKEAALLAAQAPKAPQAGKSFKDCPDCPDMVVIPAGSFEMGLNGVETYEKPQHRVSLKSFALGKTEVTQGQWKAIMGNNPSKFKACGDNCPVEQVSWDDAKQYIQKLNAKTGKQYRLPSEAEWEYACRAGGKQEYCGSDNVDSVAWYGAYATPVGNSAKTTNPVATKQANAFGLYDMSGNVWEWNEDSYHDNYNGAPTDGSVWQGDGAKRVLRGGSWNYGPRSSRAADRDGNEPAGRFLIIGFRLARMLP